MRKVMVLGIAVIFIFSLFCAMIQENVYAKEIRIGYVDLVKVFDEYTKTKESSKVVEERAKAKEAERKKLEDEVRKLKDEQALLSEKAKAEKQTVIDEKIKNLQEFVMKTRDELVRERNEIIGDIMKDIEKVVTEYSKASGYDLVLNSRTLLYGVEEFDVTEEVLKKLNKK